MADIENNEAPAPEETAEAQTEAPAPKDEEEAPAQEAEAKTETPWGDDFDAARAHELVQKLRAELREVKAARKAETEAATEQADKAHAEEVGKLRAELWREKALRAHPELADVADLLTGDSEDAVMEMAKRLSGISGKADEAPAHKPTPNLTPAHAGEEGDAALDTDAIAERVWRGTH